MKHFTLILKIIEIQARRSACMLSSLVRQFDLVAFKTAMNDKLSPNIIYNLYFYSWGPVNCDNHVGTSFYLIPRGHEGS